MVLFIIFCSSLFFAKNLFALLGYDLYDFVSCSNIHIRTLRLYFQYVFTKKTVTRCTFREPNFYVLHGVWQEHNLLLEIISSTLLKDTANPLSHHVMASSNLAKWKQALAPVNEKKAQLSCNWHIWASISSWVWSFCGFDISRLVIQDQIKPRNEDKKSLLHVTRRPQQFCIFHFFFQFSLP